MNRKSVYFLGAAAGAFVFHGAAQASEQIYYTYDALGRLVRVAVIGGPNAGLGVRSCYDSAGNRTTYTVGTAGAPTPPPCPPPPPAPPPSPPPPPPPPPSASANRFAVSDADA